MDGLRPDAHLYLGWILAGRTGRPPSPPLLGPLLAQTLVERGYCERATEGAEPRLRPTAKALRYAHLFHRVAEGPRLRSSPLAQRDPQPEPRDARGGCATLDP